MTVLIGWLLIATIACGSSSDIGPVQGRVTDVQSKSLLELESLTMVDDEGTEWKFVDDGSTQTNLDGFTPSHLREHMVQGAKITVRYRGTQDGDLVIVSITD